MKAVAICIVFVGATFGLLWLVHNCPWVVIAIFIAAGTACFYWVLSDKKEKARTEVDIKEEAYFQGFADGKKAAEEDYLEGLIKPKK